MNARTALVAGGLTAGLLDIVYAMTVWHLQGVAPMTILHSVASGLLGRAAYEGGVASALVGLLAHFTLTLAMAAVFVTWRRRRPRVLANPLLAGAVYGLLVFGVMNLLVVPLSRAPVAFPSGWLLAGALFAHIVLVGMPIALFAGRIGGAAPAPGSRG